MPSRKSLTNTPLPRSSGSGHHARSVQFSRPWMALWVEAAARTGKIADACEAAGVTLADYHDGRTNDLAFDEACRVHDRVVDLRITESLRIGAMDGDIRSQGLYFSRVRDLVFRPAGVNDHGDAILSPTVAEAMLRAGLDAATKATSKTSRRSPSKSTQSPPDSEDLDPLDLDPLPF